MYFSVDPDSAVRNHMAVGISQPVGHPDIADMNGIKQDNFMYIFTIDTVKLKIHKVNVLHLW